VIVWPSWGRWSGGTRHRRRRRRHLWAACGVSFAVMFVDASMTGNLHGPKLAGGGPWLRVNERGIEQIRIGRPASNSEFVGRKNRSGNCRRVAVGLFALVVLGREACSWSWSEAGAPCSFASQCCLLGRLTAVPRLRCLRQFQRFSAFQGQTTT
jgi:hypothetical protein